MSSVSIASFDQFKNTNGTYTIDVDKFREIIKSGGKMKRPMSGYFLWLKKERASIREKYFSDYDSIEEWNSENLAKYFSEKELGTPKKEGKPKIVSLVTMKAGKLWKQLTDEEKKPFLDEANELKKEYNEFKKIADNYKESVKKETKDEDNQIDGETDETIENDEADEMMVEEYTYKGVVYYYNEEKGEFYNPETGDKVAQMVDGKFTFI